MFVEIPDEMWRHNTRYTILQHWPTFTPIKFYYIIRPTTR